MYIVFAASTVAASVSGLIYLTEYAAAYEQYRCSVSRFVDETVSGDSANWKGISSVRVKLDSILTELPNVAGYVNTAFVTNPSTFIDSNNGYLDASITNLWNKYKDHTAPNFDGGTSKLE